ncbi:hypothetical protein SAMN04515692_11357 [Leifsonia sp. CL147]|nr:hypothetical protein SAMN04515692_11357 [Leifsonia sp. CL147]
MSQPLRVVGVSGSPTHPSHTTVLVDEVAHAYAEAMGGISRTIRCCPS